MKNFSKKIIPLYASLVLLISCATENKSVLRQFASDKPKLLVCPVHILDSQNSFYDTSSSKRIVEYINRKKYAEAILTDLTPPPNNEWRANEAKILTISINKFSEFVKEKGLPDKTYILYPEFLKMAPGSKVVAIHYCLLNNKGEIAMRGLLNSHWEEFRKVNPRTNDDCVQVFINGFENKMKDL
jgi:hypothetical protein